MKYDNKGSGMLGSMVGTMVVIIALSVFMCLICYVQTDENPTDNDDFQFVNTLEIKEGKITGEVRDDLAYLAESNGYSKVELRVNVIGNVNGLEFRDSFGDVLTDNVETYYGTFNIKSDDGRSLLADYEVVIWF